MTHAQKYLDETGRIAGLVDAHAVEALALHLVALRGTGRLFIVGLGGSAANASHAASDFTNLCGLNALCLTDNVAEFTAAANDDGWENAFRKMMVRRDFDRADTLMVLSVGGGAVSVKLPSVSLPLVRAMEYASLRKGSIVGIVGRDGGVTAKYANPCVIIPTVESSRVTPHTEGWQMVIIHALVSHPKLQQKATTW